MGLPLEDLSEVSTGANCSCLGFDFFPPCLAFAVFKLVCDQFLFLVMIQGAGDSPLKNLQLVVRDTLKDHLPPYEFTCPLRSGRGAFLSHVYCFSDEAG